MTQFHHIKAGSHRSIERQFALHCSPVRLALRVLNHDERANPSRFPFTNAMGAGADA